ncbi:MAG: heparan-alpha-glucosaminide N-acetyltransferase domain-containing protein [Promethearchaeota archaeon]
MKRFKSIDIFRGLGMIYIMASHMIDWWAIEDWLFYIPVSLFSALGAAGFVFISGVSTMISYRKRFERVKTDENYNYNTLRKEYLIRGLLILGLGIVYNGVVAIEFLDPLIIWKWFIILTVAASLLLAWPFLRTSKMVRIFTAVIIWIVNQVVLAFLMKFEGKFDFFGIIFFILYNSLDQNPILAFFTFFIIGTVIGDMIYDYSNIEMEAERKKFFKMKIIIPILVCGIILIAASFWFLLPNLFTEKILTINTNIWWLTYTLGLDLIIILILLILEENNFFDTKKSYKILFYFSYYSLTLFLLQNINYFLFLGILNRFNIWIFIIITMIGYGLFLRLMYKRFEGKFSLKVQIGRLTLAIMRRLNNQKPLK